MYFNIAYSFLQDSMERDKFMSPEEAKEFGLIDVILEHPPKVGEDEEGDNPGDTKEDKE